MKKTIGSRLLSMALTAFMAVSCVNTAVPLRASAVTGNAVADASTKDSWQSVLNLNGNPSNVGKVWADKSVEVDASNNFKHTFSLLGSSDKVSNNKFAEPLDVVFILDISFSMASDETTYGGKEGNTRLINSAKALDEAMKLVMDAQDASPYNRVGVVTYHTIAETVMPLGRYMSNNGKYFKPGTKLYTESNEYMTITAKAVSGSGGSINKTEIEPPDPYTLGKTDNYTNGYTNTQAGLYMGMNMLREASDVSFWVDKDGERVPDKASGGIKELHRQPIVILISDGVPTRISSSDEWWNPIVNVTNQVYGGKNNDAYPELSMISMATGSYMRQKIDEHYGIKTPDVFTIGLELPVPKAGILDSVSQDEADLGPVTLNPALLDSPEYQGLSVVEKINGYWNSYNSGNDVVLPTAKRPTGSVGVNDKFTTVDYTMFHPSDYDITTLDYVDEFFDVKKAEELSPVLQEIVTSLAEDVVPVPVEGTITYTDPIGKYMEVKSVDTLELFGVPYTLTGDGSGNYQVANDATVLNPAYGTNEPAFNLSDIKVKVEIDSTGNQAVRVDVPAVALPLWMANDSGSYTTDGVQPLRVTYTVGMADAYLKDGAVDFDTIDDDYISANTVGNKVYFYSNLCTGTNGDAKVTFSPSVSNKYYVSNTNAESINKLENSTGTASTYYSSLVQDGIVNINNGNNGRLAVDVPESGSDPVDPPVDPPVTPDSPVTPDPPATTSGPSVFKTEISAGGNTVSKENGNLDDENSDWLIGPNVKKFDEIVYNIGWDNSKSGKTLTSITITDELDAGLELIGAGFSGAVETIKAYPSEWSITEQTGMCIDGNNKIVYESTAHKVTWIINNPENTGVVALKVKVKSDAVSRVVNDATVTFNYGSTDTKTLDTNRVENPLLGSIAIEKEIQATDIDAEKGFNFEVTLEIPLSTAVTKELTCTNPDGTSGKITFTKKDGKYSAIITLRHNEKILIYDLPYGTKFEVTETASDGYYLKNITKCSKGAKYDTSFKKVYGTITEENASASMKFVNAPVAEYPETGGTGVRWIYLLGIGFMLTAVALVYIKKRNQYKQFEIN